MLALVLALPLASAPTPGAAPLFATLTIEQPLGEGVPMVGGRLGAVFESGFGVEASATAAFVGTLGEVSAVGALEPRGQTVLLRAGLTGIDAPRATEHSSARASTGFHVGTSFVAGGVDDRARLRLDYTYRQLFGRDRGFSSVGLALVLKLGAK
jgi:hypothetical protein